MVESEQSSQHQIMDNLSNVVKLVGHGCNIQEIFIQMESLENKQRKKQYSVEELA